MNRSPSVELIGLVASISLWLTVGLRHRELMAVRQQRLNFGTTPEAATVPDPAEPVGPTRASPLSEAEKIELLRLRGEVARRRSAGNSLTELKAENARLKAIGPARGGTSKRIRLPEGYHLASQAKFAGYATPENTLETLAWAVCQRNTQVLLNVFDTETASKINQTLNERGLSNVFDGLQGFVGYRIRSSRPKADDGVELEVQLNPNSERQLEKVSLQRSNGAWKLLLHD